MALPGPDQARGWLGMLYPLMERGGGVLALAFLLIGGSIVWFLIGALERSVVRNHQLVERLQGCMKEQVELVLRLREHQQ
jgi:hypothetical protein